MKYIINAGIGGYHLWKMLPRVECVCSLRGHTHIYRGYHFLETYPHTRKNDVTHSVTITYTCGYRCEYTRRNPAKGTK